MTVMIIKPARAEISMSTWGQGGIRIGETAIPCTAAAEGALRYDTVGKGFEFCNGTAWLPVLLAMSQPWIVVTPTVKTLDVAGPGTPAYGAWETFTVENLGSVDSGTITFTLTNTAHFELGANTCVGGGAVLSQGESCTVQVRAKSGIDTSYSGQLRVNANNQPTANLSGAATGTCGAPGDDVGGGKLVSCEASYALVATPGGCTDSGAPSCPGTLDLVTRTWSSVHIMRGATSTMNGPANAAVIMPFHTDPPTYDAVKFCDDMVYGGHSDWYLPALNELLSVLEASNAIGGFPAGGIMTYWTSTEIGATSANIRNKNMDTGVVTQSAPTKSGLYKIRCVRRHV